MKIRKNSNIGIKMKLKKGKIPMNLPEIAKDAFEPFLDNKKKPLNVREIMGL